MEAKGYDVWRERMSNLSKALCVKHQQERAAALAVEDHGDNQAFKAIRTIRLRKEYRFSGITVILEPASHLITSRVEAQKLIIKTFRPILAAACGVGRCVVQPGVARIVDRRQLGLVEQNLADCVPSVERHGVAFDLTGFERLRCSPPVDIQLLIWQPSG
jgi:hypothetical protein